MEQSRNVTIDLIKGIAVILVIWGHFIQFSTAGNYDFYGDFVFKLIYSFHMPLFAMISGYLFYNSLKKRTLKQAIGSRIKGLLWPILLWGTIRYGMDIILQIIDGKFVLSFSDWWYYITGTFLWFFWSIFAVSVCVSVIMKILPEKIQKIGLIVAFFAMYLFPNSSGNLTLYPYFIIGFWAKEKEKVWKPYQEKFLCISAISAVIWGVMFGGKEYYAKKITFLESEYGYIAQMGLEICEFLIGFFGSIAVIGGLCWATMRFSSRSVEIICNFGRNCMQIYILQTFAFWAWPRIWNRVVGKLGFNPLLTNIFLYWTITLVMSLVLLWLLKKIIQCIKREPHLHMFLFGRQ